MLATASRRRLTDDDLLDMIARRRPRAAGALPQRAAAQEPVRLRHPPAVPGVLRQGRAARRRSAKLAPGVVMDVVEKARGLRAAVHLQPRHRHHVPTGAEAEGWLITRRRHAEGADGAQPGVHLRPAARRPPTWPASWAPRSWGSAPSPRSSATPASRSRSRRRCRSPPATATARPGRCGPPTRPCDRLGLAEVDEQGRIRGRAMVVGATGAIGSVCARLLALASDELWLVSPETAKLLALKHDIEREHPRATVHVAATPDEHLADMDLIVTATSGAGQAGARHHGGQARLRDHRRRPTARPLGRGRRQAPRRPGRRVRRDRAARRRADEEHRAAAGRRLRLPRRDRRAGPRGPLRDLHRRAATSSGRRSRRSTGSASSTG